MRRSIRAEIQAMGDLLVLAERLAARRRRDTFPWGRGAVGLGATPVAFCFDTGCPFSYLVAERVERRFPTVEWVPVPAAVLRRRDPWSHPGTGRSLREHAEQRALERRLPLVWPDSFPSAGTAALRVAVYAARTGAGFAPVPGLGQGITSMQAAAACAGVAVAQLDEAIHLRPDNAQANGGGNKAAQMLEKKHAPRA